MKNSLYQNFKNKIKQSVSKFNKEKRNIYNVSFNEKDSTLFEAELEFIENAIIDYIKDYSFYYVKGYHNVDRNKGLGAEHIKLHLEKGSEGEISIEELLNLGNSIRAYLNTFKEPFTQENQTAKIYEWENDEGVRFRAIIDRIGEKHLENITKDYQEGGPQLPLSPLDEQIITFYSDRNINKQMEFKNPKVREYYENNFKTQKNKFKKRTHNENKANSQISFKGHFMKKPFFTISILLTLGFSQTQACVCAGDISSSYNNFENHITTKLNAQEEALKKLNQSITKATQTLSSQNELLNKDNALLKNEVLEEERLIFELSKRNQLKG